MNPDDVAVVIRRAIREGVFEPGQSLVQEELARRFGVSRIPIREALRIVNAEGLVTMQPGLGAVVTELSSEEMEELYGLRLRLEPPLAERIVRACNLEDIERLEQMASRMEKASESDREAWSHLNYEFHRSMYELAGQPHTVRVITQLLNLVEPYSRVYVHVLRATNRVHREHHTMVQALRSGNEERLARAIRQHLEGARRGLVRSMEDSPDEDPLELLVGDEAALAASEG